MKYTIRVTINPPKEDVLAQLQKEINVAHTGVENINVLINNAYVQNPKAKQLTAEENAVFEEIHKSIKRSNDLLIEIDFCPKTGKKSYSIKN
jgi:hypothetical protein